MANKYLFEIRKIGGKWTLYAWGVGGSGAWFGRKAYRGLDKKTALGVIDELIEGETHEIKKKQAKKASNKSTKKGETKNEG